MLMTPLAMSTLVRFQQKKKAWVPILVRLLGIDTLVMLEQFVNTLLAMMATGSPLIAEGMTTEPPEPLYCVIMIRLSLVM